jgi:hypothetical protein
MRIRSSISQQNAVVADDESDLVSAISRSGKKLTEMVGKEMIVKDAVGMRCSQRIRLGTQRGFMASRRDARCIAAAEQLCSAAAAAVDGAFFKNQLSLDPLITITVAHQFAVQLAHCDVFTLISHF